MALKIIPSPAPGYWSAHTHSRYSACDAVPSVEQIVDEVVRLHQPAVALTDHGNMAGSVELYKAAKKAGIQPFPGSELYYVPDTDRHKQERARKDGNKASRYHLGVIATSEVGYRNLVRLSSLTHRNHFHKPLVDNAMLAQLHDDGRLEDLVVTTGCFFGFTQQLLITKGEQAAKDFLRTLATWFPQVYVEMQNHNIDHGDGANDDKVADALMGIADDLGLPAIVTQDSHYLSGSDQPLHDDLKRLIAFGADPDEAVFPGDGFHVADGRWIAAHHHPARLARGLEGLGDLLGRGQLSIPVLDHYAYNVPRVVPDPQGVMETRCRAELANRKLGAKYLTKLKEEFEVISAADMAGYMILVAEVTDFMRENDIVFQTRGSAAGSLVCWLLGISNVDPLKWDLRFERFLSKDRTKPPDVDLDIAHDRRQELIDWLETRFTVHQIGTWMQFSMNGDEEDDEGKGSLLQKYFSTWNKFNPENKIHTVEEMPPKDRSMLYEISSRETYRGMGTNAAGVVITSTPKDFDNLVPIAARTKGGFLTQYHLKAIEDLGLVKLDVLGSKTLTVVGRCLALLGQNMDYLEEIPLRDAKVYAEISSGRTAGVFQLEGKSSMFGVKSLKPGSIKEVIAAMALFRPGVQGVKGDKHYIARKHGKEPMPTYHPIIQEIIAPTNAILLYQEQVIDILRRLGMEADDLTAFLKAVKASNKNVEGAVKVIASYRGWIEKRCAEEGMSETDVAYLDEAFAAFSNYSFNRAHATVYGLTAYRCAWLALHHPLEFHAALLSVATEGKDDKKERNYLHATRSRGVRVLPPQINVSGASYTIDNERGVIRKGLMTIKGVGIAAAREIATHAPYTSVSDLIERTQARAVNGRKEWDGQDPATLCGVLGILRDTGLLEPLIYAEKVRERAGNQTM